MTRVAGFIGINLAKLLLTQVKRLVGIVNLNDSCLRPNRLASLPETLDDFEKSGSFNFLKIHINN